MAVISDEVKVARPHWVGGYVLTKPKRIVTANTFHKGGAATNSGDTSRGRGGRGESVYHGAICGKLGAAKKRLARFGGRPAPLNSLIIACRAAEMFMCGMTHSPARRVWDGREAGSESSAARRRPVGRRRTPGRNTFGTQAR
jgi:hypothetical protein